MNALMIDQCHAALDGLILRYSKLSLSDANEAETRLKVIDKILKDVLGWQDDDLSEESSLLDLYDSKLGSESLQLLRFQILSRLVELASDAVFEGIAVSDITEQLHVVGVPSSLVEGVSSHCSIRGQFAHQMD